LASHSVAELDNPGCTSRGKEGMDLHGSGGGRNWEWRGLNENENWSDAGEGRKKVFVPSSHILFTKRLRPNSAALLRAVQRFPRLVRFLHTKEHEHNIKYTGQK